MNLPQANQTNQPIFYAFGAVALGVCLYLLSTWSGWGAAMAKDLADFGKALLGGGIAAVLFLVKQLQIERKVDDAAVERRELRQELRANTDATLDTQKVATDAAEAAKTLKDQVATAAIVKAEVAAGVAAGKEG